jgi:hypothetical protein
VGSLKIVGGGLWRERFHAWIFCLPLVSVSSLTSAWFAEHLRPNQNHSIAPKAPID